MSLNRALTEMFKAVREEAARNPEFAAKIGEAMAIYKPPKRRRRLPAVVAAPSPAPAKPFDLQESLARPEPPEAKDFAAEVEDEVFSPPAADAPKINPITFITREGEDALRSELEGEAYSSEGLQRLVADHNLDPAGLAAGADKAGLIDQIIAQAKKRVARDKALFDY